MTCTDIKRIINDANTNKEIKWDVIENTADKIVLGNSYDKNLRLVIQCHDDGITVRDVEMETNVEYLFKGESRWDDYKDDTVGVRLAIKSAVNYFNHVY